MYQKSHSELALNVAFFVFTDIYASAPVDLHFSVANKRNKSSGSHLALESTVSLALILYRYGSAIPPYFKKPRNHYCTVVQYDL